MKVQYPGVDRALADDLANLVGVVRALGLGTNLLDVKVYSDEVRRELSLELDYANELAQLESFRTLVAPWPDLVVPKSYPACSTRRVLTLERLVGPTLHDFIKEQPDASAELRLRIAEQLMRAVYGPFFAHGVVHADTHPGNFIVLADGRLGLLDFGSVKRFSPIFWSCYREAVQGGLEGGHIDLINLLRRGGFSVTLPDDRASKLVDDLAYIVGRPLLGPYDWGQCRIVEDARAFGLAHAAELVRVRPPPEAILFFRAVAGVTHNLRALKASGDFRPLLHELLARPTTI